MMDNNGQYAALRRQYPVFDYEGYHYAFDTDGLHLRFDFRMGDIEFHPTACIESRPWLSRDLPPDELDRLVFDIGMVETISYWKSACPPTLRVGCGTLDAEAIAFWKKLYRLGLGEFFFTNAIAAPTDDFLTIIAHGGPHCSATTPQASTQATSAADASTYLVPIGGGKDSVVSLELLRRAGSRVRPLIMNPRGATRDCARTAGFPMGEVLVIRRTIDPALLDLNRRGYLNGHTPFSAMLAFYTRLAARLSGISQVALSNESSANESTVAGTAVNHQYSKSLDFEDDFRRYASSPAFRYFSLLRPLSELQIAMLFSRLTPYHEVFRSCNAGSRTDSWCGHCAKCLFAYLILSPFLPPERLAALFGKDMLADASLRPVMLQLAGLAPTKPFECVGTVAEVRQALAMASSRWFAGGRPALLQGLPFLDEGVPQADLALLAPIGNLTPREREILQKACTAKTN
ncbi:MAG: hypothetical protein IJU19_03090 [Bacteroidales bacterium]|nr:hypothetical protein [Bacteroidales bacterium]